MTEASQGITRKPKPRAARKTDVTSDVYKLAMRHVASPVTIIAARHGDERNGLTATAVCSASADPPILVVCVNRGASAHDLIVDSGAFSVNFLAVEQTAVARLFSTSKLSPEERFGEGVWKEAVTGAPLLEDALTAFDCEIVQTHAFESHTVFFGRVCAVESRGGSALLYSDGFFRRLEPS